MTWIIIPTLNEELALPTTLTSLFQQSGTYQVVAVDGGSTDQTWALVNADPRITPLMAAKGQASMNAGAQYAWTHCQSTNDWLLFLHADTRLPDGALQRLNHLESEETCQAGGFWHRFSGNNWRLQLISWLDNFRCRKSNIIYGDQALFVWQMLFDQLGGGVLSSQYSKTSHSVKNSSNAPHPNSLRPR